MESVYDKCHELADLIKEHRLNMIGPTKLLDEALEMLEPIGQLLQEYEESVTD